MPLLTGRIILSAAWAGHSAGGGGGFPLPPCLSVLAVSTPWYTPSLDAVWQASESSSRHRWRKYSSGIGDPKGGVWPAAQEAVWLASNGNEDMSHLSCMRKCSHASLYFSLPRKRSQWHVCSREKRFEDDIRVAQFLKNNLTIGGIDAFCITVLFTLSLKDLHPTNMCLSLWQILKAGDISAPPQNCFLQFEYCTSPCCNTLCCLRVNPRFLYVGADLSPSGLCALVCLTVCECFSCTWCVFERLFHPSSCRKVCEGRWSKPRSSGPTRARREQQMFPVSVSASVRAILI